MCVANLVKAQQRFTRDNNYVQLLRHSDLAATNLKRL